MRHCRIASFRRLNRADQFYERFRRGLRLRIELLEPRLAMDGALPALETDVFTLLTNSDPTSLDVLANDAWGDYIGPRTITSVSFPSAGGRADVSTDGRSIDYRPSGDFSGEETLIYFVDDWLSAQVTVHVQSPLVSDVIAVDATGDVHTLDVLANDFAGLDYSGPRKITVVSSTALGGQASIAADGKSLTYLAPDDPNTLGRADHVSYIVDGKYPADVTVTLSDPLQPDFVELLENSQPTTLLPLENDPFWTGYTGPRIITSATAGGSSGRVTIAEDGRALIYQPANDFVGSDTITYIVDRRFAASYVVNVLQPVRDDGFSLDENDPGTLLPVLQNDVVEHLHQSPTRIVARITSVGATRAGGTVEISDDGQSIRYTPPANFVGTDGFVYQADGKYTARVSVSVSRPVRDDSFGVTADSADNVLPVLSNDFQRPGPHTITAVGSALQGGHVTVSANGTALLYSPRPGFVGTDQFTYTVDGGFSASVFVGVRPPVADSYVTLSPLPDNVYTLEVVPNAEGFERYTGPGLITAVELTSGHGVASVSPSGKAIVFAAQDFDGATITYTLDGKYTARLTAHFVRSPFLLDDVLVVDQNLSSTLDVEANDPWEYTPSYGGRIVYTGARTITAVYGAEHGTAVIAADGKSLIYQSALDYVGDDHLKYVVDGHELAFATIHVIRHVRDDQFNVALNSQNNRLPVLANDLFATGYVGAGKISSVSQSAHGGQVSVVEDGRIVIYTPAPGYSGTDDFSYLVDGHLRANVHVAIAAPQESLYPRFTSVAELKEWLLAGALDEYESLFGKKTYRWQGPVHFGIGDQLYGSALQTPAAAFDRSHSETNVQVAGVDEADISEADSEYLYVLSGGKLIISRAWPAESLSIASETRIDGTPVGMYLSGDRLTVVARSDFGRSLHDAEPRPFAPMRAATTVTIFNVANRREPRVVQKMKVEGTYVDSRAIGDFVYLNVRSMDQFELPRPEVKQDDGMPPDADGDRRLFMESNGRYETRDEYIQRVREHFDELLDKLLPHFQTYGPDGNLIGGGLLVAPEGLGRPQTETDRSLFSVVAINRAAAEPRIASSTGILASVGDEIVLNHQSLFFLQSTPSDEDGQGVRILRFQIDESNGQITPAARGEVTGSLLDQFSVDELDGNLRIATTTGNNFTGNWSGRAENDVWVLRQDGDLLETIGSLKNLAPGESIRSVRYLGNRAVVTTFPTAVGNLTPLPTLVGIIPGPFDPVYVVDFSVAAQPRVLGALTLPGFNQYMQFIDETHVLTVGVNMPGGPQTGSDWGWRGASRPLQISLFDVSDLAHPQLLDQHTLSRFSASVAQNDHHAFGWFAEHGLLALPIARSVQQRVDRDGDGYRESMTTVFADEVQYFRIHTSGASDATRAVEFAGAVTLSTAAQRTAFIGDTLLAIGDGQVVATAVERPDVPLASVTWRTEAPWWPDVRVIDVPGLIELPWRPVFRPIDVVPFDPVLRPIGDANAEAEPAVQVEVIGTAAAQQPARLSEALRSEIARPSASTPGIALLRMGNASAAATLASRLARVDRCQTPHSEPAIRSAAPNVSAATASPASDASEAASRTSLHDAALSLHDDWSLVALQDAMSTRAGRRSARAV